MGYRKWFTKEIVGRLRDTEWSKENKKEKLELVGFIIIMMVIGAITVILGFLVRTLPWAQK